MQLVSFFLVLNVPGNFGVSVLFCIVSLFPSLQSGGQLIDLRISDFILISDEEETETFNVQQLYPGYAISPIICCMFTL